MSELQDDLFARLFDLDLQEFPTKESQNITKTENIQQFVIMSLSSQSQLLTTRQYIVRQIWEYVSNYIPSLLTLRFYNKDINAKIKVKCDLDLHLWYINMIADIAYFKKDVFIIVKINAGKSLTY